MGGGVGVPLNGAPTQTTPGTSQWGGDKTTETAVTPKWRTQAIAAARLAATKGKTPPGQAIVWSTMTHTQPVGG